MMALEYLRVNSKEPLGVNSRALARINLRRFNNLCSDQPLGRLFMQHRPWEDLNLPVAGRIVFSSLIKLRHLPK